MLTTVVNNPQSNHESIEELWAKARAFGADTANGRESQIKFDLMLVENAFHGTLDLHEKKYDKSDSDADRMFKMYTEGKTKCQFFDKKSDSGKKTLSNIKKMIRLGNCPKWGRSTYDNVNELMTLRKREMEAGKKVKDAHNCLLEYATAQLGSEYLITGDELKAYVYSKEKESATGEDALEKARKEISKVTSGKLPVSPAARAKAAEVAQKITEALTLIARGRSGV